MRDAFHRGMRAKHAIWLVAGVATLLHCQRGPQPEPALLPVKPQPVRATLVRATPAPPRAPVVVDPPPTPGPAIAAPAPAEPPGKEQEREELVAVQKELATLRTRTAQLEQQLARLEQEHQERAQVVEELQGLRAQFADAEDQRRAEAQRAAQHEQEVDGAITGLLGLHQKLDQGDTDLEATLASAARVLGPQARWDLDRLRNALENDDLAAARVYLTQAIVDAQRAR